MSGWWSVTIVKCGKPTKNNLHLIIAHDTTNNSSSMIAYRDCISEKSRPSLDEGPVVVCFFAKG